MLRSHSPQTARLPTTWRPACTCRSLGTQRGRDGRRTQRISRARPAARQRAAISGVCTKARVEDRQSAQCGLHGGELAREGQGRTFGRACRRRTGCQSAFVSAQACAEGTFGVNGSDKGSRGRLECERRAARQPRRCAIARPTRAVRACQTSEALESTWKISSLSSVEGRAGRRSKRLAHMRSRVPKEGLAQAVQCDGLIPSYLGREGDAIPREPAA